MEDFSILRFTFPFDVVREILVPIRFCLPVCGISNPLNAIITKINCDALVRVEHIAQKDILRGHALGDHRPGSKRQISIQYIDIFVAWAYSGWKDVGAESILASLCISACRDAAFKLPPRITR